MYFPNIDLFTDSFSAFSFKIPLLVLAPSVGF